MTSKDSCINQLISISITHNILEDFDVNPSSEVHGVFLDLSKAFCRVWHEYLLCNLKKTAVLSADLSHDSVLGPLFFLIYLNDLLEGLK